MRRTLFEELKLILGPNGENAEQRCEKRTDEQLTDISLSLRKFPDSAKEARTMVKDRDCLSKGKKGKHWDFPQVRLSPSRVWT